MQLEYIYRKRDDNHGRRCVIISRRDTTSGEIITIQFTDGTIIDCKRNAVITMENYDKRKKRTKTTHPPYDTQLKFHTWEQHKYKLKRYLKKNRITQNDLFNNYIATL